jgi:retron-type reverse transcriptase
VESPKEYRAKPLKRVMIPKPGKKELRGLGIPTLTDRTVQAVYHLAVDPVVECRSDLNSFGFRKRRGTQDVVKPSEKGILNILSKIKDIISETNIKDIIFKLNPVLRG